MSNKITLNKFVGKSKKTGKEFHAYELRVGSFSRLIFPNSKVEDEYLDNILTDNAHDEFKRDLDDDVF